MQQRMSERVEKMYLSDIWFAGAMIAAVWLSVGFVFYEMFNFLKDPGFRIVEIVAALFLLVFNSSSMTAMIRHYKEDKEWIYERDIVNLDLARAEAARDKKAA
ncbi:MAG: hypothetical protein KGQ58_07295 [Proteobacteria bacterium]|nr:hypothetical protein [Pseudomonadota bacterium]MDE3207634.1 hypothetical protein [Pseudomonadota bacterium]